MKIGLIASTFDLLHAGHVHFIQRCMANCDTLVCALQTGIHDRPDKNSPVQTVYERWSQVRALRGVGPVIPYESEQDLLNLLKTTKHDVRFLGTDYVGKQFTGMDLYSYSTYDGDPIDGHIDTPYVMYIERNHNYSTSELRKRVAAAETKDDKK